MSDDFDPRAYAAQVNGAQPAQAEGFDPRAYAAQVQNQEPATLGPVSTGLMHYADWTSGGLGHKIQAAEMAAWEKFKRKQGDESFGDAYRRNLDFVDKISEASDKAHPIPGYVGDALGLATGLGVGSAGSALTRALGLGKFATPAAEAGAQGASKLGQLWSATKQGAKAGSAFGGVSGYGSSRADSALDEAKDIGAGSLGGLLLGAAAPSLIAGVAGGARAIRGAAGGLGNKLLSAIGRGAGPAVEASESAVNPSELPALLRSIKPTKEAQALQRQGVHNLTVGQMSPDSVAGEAEAAAQRIPVLGKKILAQQKAPEDLAKYVAMTKAMPTEGPVASADLNEQLGDIYKRFDAAYAPIKEHPVQALGSVTVGGKSGLAPLDKAFAMAAFDPNVPATQEDRTRALNWLMNQATTEQLGVGNVSPTNSADLVKADDVLRTRSAIRTAIRNARGNPNDSHFADLLRSAEKSLTGGLESQLSPEASQLLQGVDQKYAHYKTLEDALWRAGDQPHGFTWKQLSNAVRSSTDKGDYARGGGNDLREIASAAQNVFTQPVRTGFGEKLGAPFALAAGPMVYNANASGRGAAALMDLAQRGGSSLAKQPQPYGQMLMQLMNRTPQALGAGIGKAEQ